jgi:hypothetical protein
MLLNEGIVWLDRPGEGQEDKYWFPSMMAGSLDESVST